MSTIPTTFNERRVDYTVAGGKAPAPGSLPLSLVVIHRGSRHLRAVPWEDLARFRFSSAILLDPLGAEPDAEGLCARHPGLRVVSVRQRITAGEAVNIGIAESSGDFVLVMWSDMALSLPPLSPAFVERLRERKSVCVVPLLMDPNGKVLPSMAIPALQGRSALRLISVEPEREGQESLFPWDYAGFYAKDRFMLSGGFDHGIPGPWWQKADFGFRCHLWGERIRHDAAIKLSYLSSPTPEDTSAGPDYARFYLKNLAVRHAGDSGSLPLGRFLRWMASSGMTPLRAWREFSMARSWVRVNRYRFLSDARGVADLWERRDEFS